MALSMEEQRILAEIERQLADDDPSLAVRLSTFRRPGLTAHLRTPRGPDAGFPVRGRRSRPAVA